MVGGELVCHQLSMGPRHMLSECAEQPQMLSESEPGHSMLRFHAKTHLRVLTLTLTLTLASVKDRKRFR